MAINATPVLSVKTHLLPLFLSLLPPPPPPFLPHKELLVVVMGDHNSSKSAGKAFVDSSFPLKKPACEVLDQVLPPNPTQESSRKQGSAAETLGIPTNMLSRRIKRTAWHLIHMNGGRAHTTTEVSYIYKLTILANYTRESVGVSEASEDRWLLTGSITGRFVDMTHAIFFRRRRLLLLHL